MKQIAVPRPERSGRARIAAWLVGVAVVGGAAAHVVAALAGPPGAMAWWMAAMGLVCLSCLLPLSRPSRDAGHAAGHLMAMSAGMILIHATLLLMPGLGAHHGAAAGPDHASHAVPMLLLIGAELLCVMSASVALRMNRSPLRAAFDPAVL